MISFFFQPVFLLLVSLIRSCLLSGLELVIIDNWFNPHLFVVLICLQLVEMVSLWIKLPFVKRRIQPKAARPAALLISAVLVVARIGLGIFLFMPFIRILALVSQSSNWAGLGMLALITFVLIKDTMISLIGWSYMLNDSRQNFSFNENLKDEWERLADLGLVIYSAVVVVAGWDLVVLQYPLESSFLGVIGAIALFTLIYFATRWLEMFELLLTESKIRQKLLVVSIFIVSLLLVFNWL